MQPLPPPQTVVTKKGANHVLHLIITLCTCGLWAITGWPIAAIMGRRSTATAYPQPPQGYYPYPGQQPPPGVYPPAGQQLPPGQQAPYGQQPPGYPYPGPQQQGQQPGPYPPPPQQQ